MKMTTHTGHPNERNMRMAREALLKRRDVENDDIRQEGSINNAGVSFPYT